MPRVRPYSLLPRMYDTVMAHVDYSDWVDYVEQILHVAGALPTSILELGCGTGTFAVEYTRRHDVRYLATDGNSEMLEIALGKGSACSNHPEFRLMDFTRIETDESFDCVLLLYDGLNYLLNWSNLEALISGAIHVLKPDGLFLFDQSTPVNSENNEDYFEDRGACGSDMFVRKSAYDCETRVHTTVFELDISGRRYVEEHRQKAYTRTEIASILRTLPVQTEGCYADFGLSAAGDDAERIHWVVRKRSPR